MVSGVSNWLKFSSCGTTPMQDFARSSCRVQVVAKYAGGAGGLVDERGDNADQRGLAGAIGAEQARRNRPALHPGRRRAAPAHRCGRSWSSREWKAPACGRVTAESRGLSGRRCQCRLYSARMRYCARALPIIDRSSPCFSVFTTLILHEFCGIGERELSHIAPYLRGRRDPRPGAQRSVGPSPDLGR